MILRPGLQSLLQDACAADSMSCWAKHWTGFPAIRRMSPRCSNICASRQIVTLAQAEISELQVDCFSLCKVFAPWMFLQERDRNSICCHVVSAVQSSPESLAFTGG